MNENSYKALMEELRGYYRERDFKKLKSKYLLSRWMLTPEDREKIEKVIYIPKEPGEQSILELAQKKMGGVIIPIDKK
jgi:hypothetical protein